MDRQLIKVPDLHLDDGCVEEPEKNLKVIMKDGKIYKNTP
jgi:hypothetical protein